jgi:hypothetical protein
MRAMFEIGVSHRCDRDFCAIDAFGRHSICGRGTSVSLPAASSVGPDPGRMLVRIQSHAHDERAPRLQLQMNMTRPRFFGTDPQRLRDQYWDTVAIAERLLADEDELIEALKPIDARRVFVIFGFKSLRTFCVTALRLPKTQSQRIVTRVRRERCSE